MLQKLCIFDFLQALTNANLHDRGNGWLRLNVGNLYKKNDIMTINRPNLGGIYGGTANPLRQVFMIGVIWRLAHDFGREPLNLVEVGSGRGLRTHLGAGASGSQ